MQAGASCSTPHRIPSYRPLSAIKVPFLTVKDVAVPLTRFELVTNHKLLSHAVPLPTSHPKALVAPRRAATIGHPHQGLPATAADNHSSSARSVGVLVQAIRRLTRVSSMEQVSSQ